MGNRRTPRKLLTIPTISATDISPTALRFKLGPAISVTNVIGREDFLSLDTFLSLEFVSKVINLILFKVA